MALFYVVMTMVYHIWNQFIGLVSRLVLKIETTAFQREDQPSVCAKNKINICSSTGQTIDWLGPIEC